MTPPPASGLPGRTTCPVCGGENQAQMNFCRHCGTALALPQSAPPAMPTPVPGRGLDVQLCRQCGGTTQAGFAFCQHCGAMLPTAPAGQGFTLPRGAHPAGPAGGGDGSPEAIAATLAASGDDAMAMVRSNPAHHMAPVPPLPSPTPPPGAGPRAVAPSPVMRAGGDRPWATLFSVKRDGSDGDRFPLGGDWVEVGRQAPGNVDIVFDDRFLAVRHARFERQPQGGCRVVPIDMLNGVYRKVRAPYVIPNGSQVLIGREVLRFELVDNDEREIANLVRFGVAMFGSPPRKPWGRLVQVLGNGGIRDVRHLIAPEVVLGREEGDIVFRDDEFLSRRHAALRWQNGQCVLEDLKSSNGTFIRLRGPQPLEHGDVLRMGDQMFRLELGGG